MVKVIGYFILFSCLLQTGLVAQNRNKTDSLIALLEDGALNDQEKVQILYHISLTHPNSIEGIQYAKEGLTLTQNSGSDSLHGALLEMLGTHHRLLGNKTVALQNTLQALHIYEQADNKSAEAAVYLQLGEQFVLDGDNQQAVQYLIKGKNLYHLLQDTFNIALSNINLGEAYRLLNQLDSAAIGFQNALHLNQKLQNKRIQGYAIGNLGMVSNGQNQLNKAMTELQEAIAILTELGDPYSVAVYQAEVGQVLLKQQQFNKAETQFLTAFQLVEKEGLKEQIRDISKMLVDFYEAQGRYQEGMQYQKIYQTYQDSLVNRENVQQLEQIKANYQIEKRETAISYLEDQKETQEQITYGFATSASLLAFLAIGLIWSYRKLAQRKRLIELREQEKALLLKELNHRVKNNLQMISSLLNLQSRQFKGHPAKEALTAGKLRVEAMSLIHQKLYQENHQTQVPIHNYIEELLQNLQAAYAEDTTLDIKIQDIQLDIDLAIPLALIINELAINAFKYAFENVEQPTLSIQLSQQEKEIELIIADNGIGMEVVDLKNTTSFGLKLVHSLVRQLGGKIHLTDGTGSKWHIQLKVENRFTH